MAHASDTHALEVVVQQRDERLADDFVFYDQTVWSAISQR